MPTRELYHGTTGDNILEILRQGSIRPNADGKVFFSEWRFDSVLMHGADLKRKAAYAVKLLVSVPSEASLKQEVTMGVSDTLIITTETPLQVRVLELYVREPKGSSVTRIKGEPAIRKYLSA